jgi:hypothetical protein
MIAKATLDRRLTEIAVALDIPDALHAAAVAEYEAIGGCMIDADKTIGRNPPEVYAQGSFRIGTVIRPLLDSEDYDIDVVYRRDLRKASTTQEALKSEAGDHMRKFIRSCAGRDVGTPELEEKSRCWTLRYGIGFHMDVLPAIPDDEGEPSSLLITDRDLLRWQHSDPIGYSSWFKGKMKVEFEEARRALLMAEAVESVPDWRVKTTLQRSVQILKRHRDIRFRDDIENKPTSIILTTLAARAYRQQSSLYDALMTIVTDMRNHIEIRDGVYWVPNPVNDEENFADRWQSFPERRVRFYEWLDHAFRDFGELSGAMNESVAMSSLSHALGGDSLNEGQELGAKLKVVGTGLVLRDNIPPLMPAPQAEQPPWPMEISAKVTVRVYVHTSLHGSRMWAMRPGSTVAKSRGLMFVAETNVREPFDIKWQVVNTGKEAQEAGQLRGEFNDEPINNRIHWEQTQFAGTHWVQAFVLKNKRCIARSARTYVRVRG